MKKTKKINGVVYTSRTCSTTNAGAKKLAKGIRSKEGILARVVSSGDLFCVYTRKKQKIKRTKEGVIFMKEPNVKITPKRKRKK